MLHEQGQELMSCNGTMWNVCHQSQTAGLRVRAKARRICGSPSWEPWNETGGRPQPSPADHPFPPGLPLGWTAMRADEACSAQQRSLRRWAQEAVWHLGPRKTEGPSPGLSITADSGVSSLCCSAKGQTVSRLSVWCQS